MQCDILYDFKTFKTLEFISKKNIFQLCECFSIDCILHWFKKCIEFNLRFEMCWLRYLVEGEFGASWGLIKITGCWDSLIRWL
jgi:hypothetical protein